MGRRNMFMFATVFALVKVAQLQPQQRHFACIGSSDIYRVASLDREGGFEICRIKFLFGIIREGRVNLIVMHGQSACSSSL